MYKEDYVSFEVAKLLKEKWFDWECFQYWHEDDNKLIHSQSMHPIQNISNPCFFGPAAPTIQMAMKWLRLEHNLGVLPYWSQISGKFGCRIYDLTKKGSQEYYSIKGSFDGPEEPAELGIKYCLENLI